MLTTREVLTHIVAEPFRPFRIRMANGMTFDIQYPEMIAVGRTSASIYTASGSDPSEKWRDASLVLMEAIEPLDVSVHPTKN